MNRDYSEHREHSEVDFPYISLIPRPHLQKGKGSGELGQNPWACTEEFPRANEIAALLSHKTSLPQECNIALYM